MTWIPIRGPRNSYFWYRRKFTVMSLLGRPSYRVQYHHDRVRSMKFTMHGGKTQGHVFSSMRVKR